MKSTTRSGIKKSLLYLLMIVTAFLIQTCIFPLIPFITTTPNLLLILTFSFGLIHGSIPGMIYGVVCGLMMDLFYSGPFGFYTLIYVTIGYLNGICNRFYYEEYIQLPMTMCVINLLLYNSYIYVFRFFIREIVRRQFHLGYYALHIVLPEIVFSLIVTLILYRFFFTAAKKIDRIGS